MEKKYTTTPRRITPSASTISTREITTSMTSTTTTSITIRTTLASWKKNKDKIIVN